MTERNEPLPILSQNNIQFPSDEKLSKRSFPILEDFYKINQRYYFVSGNARYKKKPFQLVNRSKIHS